MAYITFDQIAFWKEWEVIHGCWGFSLAFSIAFVSFLCDFFVNLIEFHIFFKTDFAFSLI